MSEIKTQGRRLLMNKFRNLILLTLFISFSSVSAQEASEAWVARYNGLASGEDVPVALAADDTGNVYVTGLSQGLGTGKDIVTLKYSSAGNLVWERRYNGPDNLADQPSALVLDQNGNLFVTGYSATLTAGTDFLTLKYSPSGTLLWVNRYNGTGNGSDLAASLKVDASGNVYATGTSFGAGTAEDYATIKYGPAGNLIWVRRYDGPVKNADQAAALVLDPAGNLYVTGSSWGGNSWDMATLKYDSNGNLVWLRRYNGGKDADMASGLALDPGSNIYVTGRTSTWGGNSYYKFLTVKYDSNGNLIWTKTYQGYSSNHSFASALKVDRSGNILVTGPSWGIGTSYDFATLKYDPNGNQPWANRYNGPSSGGDFPAALTVDSGGNLYVAGSRYVRLGQPSYDIATIKYSPLGQELWIKSYNGGGIDKATALALDNQGNLYVTGFSQGSLSSYDFVTIKYAFCSPTSPQAGDADSDGKLNLSDVVAMVNYIFQKPNYPFCSANSPLCWLSGQLCRGDWNGDGKVSLSDLLRGVSYIFGKSGGPWEPIPSGACCSLLP
jgi:uncharacterized delta-60 repeat protein